MTSLMLSHLGLSIEKKFKKCAAGYKSEAAVILCLNLFHFISQIEITTFKKLSLFIAYFQKRSKNYKP